MSTFKVGDLIKPTGVGDERAIRTETQLTGSNADKKTVLAEYTLNAGSTPSSYGFITNKMESRGNAIYIADYKYIDIFIVAAEAHVFGLNSPMYQRILPPEESEVSYKGGSGDLGLFRDDYDEFVFDYKLNSNGGEAVYIKGMKVFGNYFEIRLSANQSDKQQNYLMMINLYN